MYALGELSSSPSYNGRLRPMLHVLYGFRVDRSGLEISAYQADGTDDDRTPLLDGVGGVQVDRIRSRLGS